ncbi:MAG: glucose-1-phosphate adenylyltransferase [Candidatus Abyssobacteria bacterium SURF_5]|uniref:Glucose-1-phosphate adenylyltransferase n=1 Tax=Abyssobacteria bacterium (strain SURF_5) TaxID=2093360 RepID=A0A3A4NW37_ABYX5|nr:MAG: glucose-1-phosphate adenylyltransferase [Candidatus Abyssubacteria bacterium SURF_5]
MKAKEVLAVVLAGGVGTRLYPLTRDRAKPAVPFGGIYRLIDFTLSNAINSDIRKIFILSQYKSLSLHRHIQFGWNIFNPVLNEFITLLPPQQRINEEWYTGTASAVHQNLYSIRKVHPRYVLILSADHVYKMDYSKMVEFHEETGADLTVGAIDVPLNEAHRFGVLCTDGSGRINRFIEKPKNLQSCTPNGGVLGSMGIYVFSTEVLAEVLERGVREGGQDFGKDIIPMMLDSHRVQAYPFVDENKKQSNYWRDVGTIDSYWDCNMDLVSVDPAFNLYDVNWPIRTYQEQYPPAKTVFAGGDDGKRIGLVLDSLVSNGCIISGGRVQHSILSPGVKVNSYSEVYDSILMSGVQVGRHARIRRAIIDKRVIIPPGTEIGYDLEEDRKRFSVSENGIVVIPKGTILSPVPVMAMPIKQKSVSAHKAAPLV